MAIKDKKGTIKGVIFDFNGTLVDDAYYHNTAWQKIAKDCFNKNLSIKEIKEITYGKYNAAVIDALSDTPLTKEENYKISLKKEEMYRKSCLEDGPFELRDGAKTLFMYLKSNNIPFTIASVSIKENIDFFYEHFKLDEFIKKENIIYDTMNFTSKSDFYIEAAKRLNLDIKDILVFEDSKPGIEGAIKAGCKHLIALYTSTLRHSYTQYPQIELVASDFIEILYQLVAKEVF